MTNRTASLLVLFLVALFATGVLLALTIGTLAAADRPGPWLAPIIAIACHTTTYVAGRRYILPHALAASTRRSALTLLAIVVITLAAAWSAIAALQWLVDRALAPATLTLIVWFALLSLAVQRGVDGAAGRG